MTPPGHEDCPSCAKKPETVGTPFDDPWGYCRACGYLVPVENGLRVEHRYFRSGADNAMCSGGSKPPVTPVPVDGVKPQRPLSLRKTHERSRSRGYWQQRRAKKRADARKVSLVKTRPTNPVSGPITIDGLGPIPME